MIDFDQLESETTQAKKNAKLLKIELFVDSLNACKALQPQRQLFGQLWSENEICILFGNTNIGKSLLAIQIGYQIASGAKMLGELISHVEPQKVLYFDFELSDIQHFNRYNDGFGNVFNFGGNFYRASRKDKSTGIFSTENCLKEIEGAIIETGAKVVIIDNVSAINSELSDNKAASEFMNDLKTIKMKTDSAMLIMAHETKGSSFRKTLDADAMAGGKSLQNFADSAFGFAQASETSLGKNGAQLRYLVQFKVRNYPIKYQRSSCPTLDIRKSGAFLGFVPYGQFSEKQLISDVALDVNSLSQSQIDAMTAHRFGKINAYQAADITGLKKQFNDLYNAWLLSLQTKQEDEQEEHELPFQAGF